MLVLSRRNEESVVVGGIGGVQRLKVTVLEIARGRVRLGFEAPKDVSVHREELLATVDPKPSGNARPIAHDALNQGADDGGSQRNTTRRAAPVTK